MKFEAVGKLSTHLPQRMPRDNSEINLYLESSLAQRTTLRGTWLPLSGTVQWCPQTLAPAAAHNFIWMPQKSPADGLQHGSRNCFKQSELEENKHTHNHNCVIRLYGLYKMSGGAPGSSTMPWELRQTVTEGASSEEPVSV